MNESTHWDGCEAEHPICLLRAERDEWKVAVERVEGDRDTWRQRAEHTLVELQKLNVRWRQLNDHWQKHAERVGIDANQLTDEVDRLRQRTETAESESATWREQCMAAVERAEAAEQLLRETRNYLDVTHGTIRHDNLGENLTCAGCQLGGRIEAALQRL